MKEKERKREEMGGKEVAMPESTLTQSFCVPIRELGLRPSVYWVGLDEPTKREFICLVT